MNHEATLLHLKSDNLQYNMLVHWFAGTNDSLTKHLMFQVLFLAKFFAKNHFNLFFYFLSSPI